MKKLIPGIFLSLIVAGSAHAAAWYGDAAYLACNPDVAQALRNGQITSAYDHYLQFGQFENRVYDGSCVAGQPGRGNGGGRGDHRGNGGGWDDGRGNGGNNGGGWNRPGRPQRPGPGQGFDEREYLRCNPDVARAVRRGQVPSGWAHYQQFGRRENRQLRCR